MKTAVETVELTRRFGDFTAVDRLNLRVGAGEIFGFLGANGAGKTTAIRMLCGLLLPSSGSGKVAGRDIRTESAEIKRTIGYMSQKFSLYPDLTTRENLEFYGRAYDLPAPRRRRRMAELEATLSLGAFMDRTAHSLPVGWRQRLALAAAVLHEPEILFLDEPTGGVDPVFRRAFWNMLYAMAERGITVFVTTHYMDEAEYCGRVSVMHAGRLVALGNPQELVREAGARDLQEMFIRLIGRLQEQAPAPQAEGAS